LTFQITEPVQEYWPCFT